MLGPHHCPFGSPRGVRQADVRHEVGPRLSLSLLKVEEGLCDGATLYHALVQKSDIEDGIAIIRLSGVYDEGLRRTRLGHGASRSGR